MIEHRADHVTMPAHGALFLRRPEDDPQLLVQALRCPRRGLVSSTGPCASDRSVPDVAMPAKRLNVFDSTDRARELSARVSQCQRRGVLSSTDVLLDLIAERLQSQCR